jgi:Concanavalin A-like lectin/glucanases superfamily
MMRNGSRWMWTSGLLVVAIVVSGAYADPIDVGTRLEPMIDEYLIASMDGAALKLHNPIPREAAITFDMPWEGNTCCYVTVFEDDGLFRMYFRGSNFDLATKKSGDQRVCYAESRDGIHWTRPELGLFEFEGSTANNIIWEGPGVHNFVPFKDTNPNCKPEERYKAVGGHNKGLVPFVSADAIHWTLVQEEPVITEGAFDSQNLAFYDTFRGRYVDFHRGFTDGVRAIMTCTSDDFMNWTEPQWVEYVEGTPPEHLYTNAITAYARAPHIFMGFPKRFVPSRDLHVHHHPGVSDGVFMTSRDGQIWKRWREALIRPGLQKERWVNRNNMTAWGILQTESDIPGMPDELSIYSTEGYYVGPCILRRFTTRLDGFVSVNAPATGGEFTTKPLVFADEPGEKPPEPDPIVGVTAEGAIAGAQSLEFTQAAILPLPGTQDLGTQATMAAAVRNVPAGHRRLFSAYNGGGVDTTKDELWFDMDSDGTLGKSDGAIRVGCNGELVQTDPGSIPDWSLQSGDDKVHHIAATWDDGLVVIYFDGKQVAKGGTAGRGALRFMHGDLQFGEDYAPAAQSNEPFLGLADDILVIRRVLSPEAIAAIAEQGAQAVLGKDAAPGDVLYTCEEVQGGRLPNILSSEGVGDTRLPGPPGPGDTELVINYATSAAGSLWCELQDVSGTPIPGYTLADCDEIYGDHIERAVTWRGSSELKELVGKPVRLHFKMSDADLYAIRFR